MSENQPPSDSRPFRLVPIHVACLKMEIRSLLNCMTADNYLDQLREIIRIAGLFVCGEQAQLDQENTHGNHSPD